MQIMGALATAFKDIPWPTNLSALLAAANGLFNVNVGVTLDLSCVFSSLTLYHMFFVHTYLPVALALLVKLISIFKLCGKRSPSSTLADNFAMVLLFLT